MKIIWHSNSPWANTGYGVQTKLFVPLLQERLGHEVIISAFYGLGGATLNLGKQIILPPAVDLYGNDILAAHYARAKADIVISLIDVFVMDPRTTQKFPWVAWMPVDHSPIAVPVAESLYEGKGIPVAFSRFGEETLKNAGFEPYYVPHGVEPSFLEVVSKKEAKAKLEWEDKFVVGMIAANKGHPCRKSFPEALRAFSAFAKRHPNAILYLHTERQSPIGVDLGILLRLCEVPEKQVQFVNQYGYFTGLGAQYMRDIYNGMDVLLSPSMGEGFGVPILEAQACGTPVIVTNFTSMPELCWFGKKVEGQLFYTSQMSYQKLPFIPEIEDALEWAYNLSDDDKEAGASLARENAARYHPNVVVDEYWKPVLEDIYKKLGTKENGA